MELIIVLRTACLLVALWAFWHYCWKPLALDWFRQRLFAVRDDLFLAALQNEGGLSFTHPAYKHFRQFANGLIRYGHQLSTPNLFALQLARKIHGALLPPQVFVPEIERVLAGITDENLKKVLCKFRMRCAILTVGYMTLTSPAFFIAMLACLIVGIGYALWLLVVRCFSGADHLLNSFQEAIMRHLESGAAPTVRSIEFQAEKSGGISPSFAPLGLRTA